MHSMSAHDRLIDVILGKNLLDAAWYADRFPDAGMLGMDAAYHYRHYGHLMGRPPSPAYLDADRLRALSLPLPLQGDALQSAWQHSLAGTYGTVLEYARLHVPEALSHSIATLRANAALAAGDTGGWLHHLNEYFAHYGAAPLRMDDRAAQEGGDHGAAGLLSRFGTGPLPAVTGGPLVSVIMPAWNAAGTVSAAARSILGQTWRNLELLIVDDASDDGTWAALQALAASDARVKIRRNRVNVGPYVSKNLMLDAVRGDWITGHDADDWAHPQRIEHHLNAILPCASPPRVSMPYMLRIDEQGLIERFSRVSDYCLDGVARLAAIAGTFEAGFLREELGCWDNVRFGADSEMISRARVLIGDEFRKLPQISMICLNLQGSLTNDSVTGVHPETGLSQPRRDYIAGYRGWHRSMEAQQDRSAARLSFPPQARPFEAPAAMVVPAGAICGNL